MILKRLQVLSAALKSNSRSRSRFRSTSVRAKSTSASDSIMNNSALKLWNATDFSYEYKPHPMVTLRIPGLSHESFDRDWNPKMTSLMATSSAARIYAFHKPLPSSGGQEREKTEEKYFLDWPRLTDELYTFASSTEFVMSRALYDKNTPKWPLDMKFTLGNIGNCSVASVSEFYTCDDERKAANKTPLWKNTNQFVTVDKTTRKPARLPEWYLDKYKGQGRMDKGLILKPFDRPAVTYAHPTVVQWTDTDNYGHTNWASYVRWAIDTLHAALLLKRTHHTTSYSPYSRGAAPGDSPSVRARAAVPGITREIVAQGLHKMHIIYLRECLQGEYVETHLWQDGEKELVYFSVVKDGEDVCQMKLWYFSSLQDEDEEDYPV